MSMRPVVLWDAGGKVKSTLFGSRREAFCGRTTGDQTSMLVMNVTTTDEFDPATDYLVRVVTKGNRTENQLVFGVMPKWAGGDGQGSGRCVLWEPSKMDVVTRVQPVSAAHQREWIERGLPVVGPYRFGSLLTHGNADCN